ncbi:FecR family protein [Filimonas effusa]|uniref:DUF4974 domain-containing protein n=1 Tax=Filimonas effusa TaxID=2508721 RepID=A0A4Q1DA96_9BACT|nr:FecR family protein [Filimonas effusa]RXK86160.1 DUF4974 domain-containing protein [Filimonas effusa]
MTVERLSYLFERCLDQSATPAERDEWIAMAALPEHEHIINNLLDKAYKEATATDEPDLPTSNGILSAIFSTAEPASPQRSSFFLRPWRWTAAAAILIVVAALSLVIVTRQPAKNTANNPVAATDILPGKQGAILTLENGSQISLDTVKNATLALQGGVNAKVINGALIYEGNENVTAYNTMSTPRSRQFHLTLADGTQVWLNSASAIRYPVSFTAEKRLVEVTGEAYFEVAADPAKPFIVRVNGKAEVEVLGTAFNINAYDNEANIRTTLLQGAVAVSAATVSEKVRLHPGQQAKLTSNNIQVVENVAVDKVIAWKNGKFNFEGLSFAEISRELERWYDIEIIFEGKMPDKAIWGGMSKDVPLSGVLEYFKGLDIRYRQEGRTLIISS